MPYLSYPRKTVVDKKIIFDIYDFDMMLFAFSNISNLSICTFDGEAALLIGFCVSSILFYADICCVCH